MSYNWRLGTPRGANMIEAHAESESSKDGLRRISGRNVKRSLGDHRFDSVRVFTLKRRINNKWVVVDTGRDEKAAREFLEGGAQ